MKPEEKSKTLLAKTRSMAKMYEYDVPENERIKINDDPSRLMILTLGNLGDLAADINNGRKDPNFEILKKELEFSAQFFDSYFESKLNQEPDAYLILNGSASYYLCDLPGSSKVLANRLSGDYPDLDCSCLDKFLLWLLKSDFSNYINIDAGKFEPYIHNLNKFFSKYYFTGKGETDIERDLIAIRKIAYDNGNPSELLFADVICAVIRKRIENSSWKCLPKYTDLTIDAWSSAIKKDTFIKELWPAQRILGERGVMRGKSAIIQMPTSAGKTKATELIIRSAFLTKPTLAVVIVAPFRSLCHEIKNELTEAFKNETISLKEISDVPQVDFDIMNIIDKTIIVLTPEKILYVLRQIPEFANRIDLLIYDEAHLFDDEKRGVIYELLLSSLKNIISEKTQTVLISAVLRNAKQIGQWIYGRNGVEVFGHNLLPTSRSIAFASLKDDNWKLEFVDNENPEIIKFYVPKLIKKERLNPTKKKKDRYFPHKTDSQSIALYLGIKLGSKGSVAIFCGIKASVLKLCKSIAKIYEEGLTLSPPLTYSRIDEVKRLHFLHECNLGETSPATKCSKLGIYTHSGNTPQGLRLAIEHAMQKSMIKFVICTSTLAQGINLPIRYLILTNVYQGGKKIKVRDFHNLIGRVGRSGMYTEGSIIFSDPDIFDQKNTPNGCKEWDKIKKLLDPKNSEECASAILTLFDPIYNTKKTKSKKIDLIDYVKKYLDNPHDLESKLIGFAKEKIYEGYTEENVLKQAQLKAHIFSSIESYLMAHWKDNDFVRDIEIEIFVTQTLAYQLCNAEQKKILIKVFELIAQHIKQRIPDVNDCRAFGKTLYGLNDSLKIKQWISENIVKITESIGHEKMLETIWPIICEQSKNSLFTKITLQESLKNLVKAWINGEPYFKLHQSVHESGALVKRKNKTVSIALEEVIDFCDNTLGYKVTLLIGAIIELLQLINPMKSNETIKNISELQKRLKYGLPSNLAVALYESGFSDRVISIELSSIIGDSNTDKKNLIKMIIVHKENFKNVIEKYPSYYKKILDGFFEATKSKF